MTEQEYREIIERLGRKRKQAYNNREEGYNKGIEAAMSIVKELYKRQKHVSMF